MRKIVPSPEVLRDLFIKASRSVSTSAVVVSSVPLSITHCASLARKACDPHSLGPSAWDYFPHMPKVSAARFYVSLTVHLCLTL